MQCHGAIEIGLGGAHPHGNRRHLNDLRGMLAHHVAAQHPIGGLLHHQLEQTTGTGGGQGPRHGPEAGAMHNNTIHAVAFDGLFFR